jgi:hypothetical protein
MFEFMRYCFCILTDVGQLVHWLPPYAPRALLQVALRTPEAVKQALSGCLAAMTYIQPTDISLAASLS